jgi:hypothetical protein
MSGDDRTLAPGEVETVEAPPIKGEFVAYRVETTGGAFAG